MCINMVLRYDVFGIIVDALATSVEVETVGIEGTCGSAGKDGSVGMVGNLGNLPFAEPMAPSAGFGGICGRAGIPGMPLAPGIFFTMLCGVTLGKLGTCGRVVITVSFLVYV
jgi:hypothetical protein